jgi:hypothetical protein
VEIALTIVGRVYYFSFFRPSAQGVRVGGTVVEEVQIIRLPKRAVSTGSSNAYFRAVHIAIAQFAPQKN